MFLDVEERGGISQEILKRSEEILQRSILCGGWPSIGFVKIWGNKSGDGGDDHYKEHNEIHIGHSSGKKVEINFKDNVEYQRQQGVWTVVHSIC